MAGGNKTKSGSLGTLWLYRLTWLCLAWLGLARLGYLTFVYAHTQHTHTHNHCASKYPFPINNKCAKHNALIHTHTNWKSNCTYVFFFILSLTMCQPQSLYSRLNWMRARVNDYSFKSERHPRSLTHSQTSTLLVCIVMVGNKNAIKTKGIAKKIAATQVPIAQ